MKLGVQLPNLGLLRGREAFVRTAQAAEALGYDSVWTGDHVVYPVDSSSPYPYHRGGAYSPTPLVAYDALVVLSVVAGCTERVELGTGVLVLPQRNPLLTAKQVASLDSLAGGRVILGVGSGWLLEELEALEAPDPSRRGEVLEEWIAILRACWSDEEPRYDGRFYRFDPVHFDPLPARAVPILVGGNSRGALRRAGAIGDGWFGTAVTLEEARASIAAVRRHAEEAGRDPARLTLGAGYTVRITAEEREHERHLLGTPARIAERVHALAEVGFDHIELRFAPMRDAGEGSLEAALEMIEQFAEDIAPAAPPGPEHPAATSVESRTSIGVSHDASCACTGKARGESRKEPQMHAMEQSEQPAVGDVISVGGHAIGGERILGEILEVRGEPGHERFRVRWEDGHESIFHPTDGEATIRHYAPPGASVELMRTLTKLKVEFEPRRHPRTGTAMDEARALHASPEVVGKTVVVHTPEGMVRVVIPAPERLSLSKLRDTLELDEVRFATEDELGDAYPAFELGAVPPFGGPEGERVVIDARVAKLDSVIVEAGSHSDSVRLAPADLVRITGATVADVVAD